jgi:tRNA-specific 2-thiouridylase
MTGLSLGALDYIIKPFSPALLQGRDPGKDQSYFLALTPLKALAKALFPLGESTKADVLAALAMHGLNVPQPGESQEVCFVPGDEYREFIPRMAARFNIPLSGPGPMLLRDGRRIGTHKGLWQYTEGQRKGLGVGWKEPLHVLGKEQAGNILRLGAKDDLRLDAVICNDVNILLPPDCWPETVLVKTRYREQPRTAEARLVPAGDSFGGQRLHICFARPETAVAPGQIAAVYVPDREGGTALRLAAGGVIARAEGLNTFHP